MNYENYQAEDFIKDEFFVSWVIEPNTTSAQFWKKWLKSHPEKRTEVERAKELIKSIQYKETDYLTDAEYSQLFERLLRAGEKDLHRKRNQKPGYIYGLAASFVLLIVAYLGFNSLEEEVIETPVANIKVSTEYGQRKTMQLPDGTIVKLNIGSTIEYPEVFDSGSRNVRLIGEAYFDVSNAKGWPFIIRSNELITEVLGTSFNVSAYPEDSTIAVSVVSGLVKISNKEGETELLSPSDMGIFSKHSKTLDKSIYDPEILSWYHGILIFKNTPLNQVFLELEKWYGVDFEFRKGVLLEGTYSGKYQNKSLELILEGISYTTDLKYNINQKTVLIYE